MVKYIVFIHKFLSITTIIIKFHILKNKRSKKYYYIKISITLHKLQTIE